MRIIYIFCILITFVSAEITFDINNLKSKLNQQQSKIFTKLLKNKYPKLANKLENLQQKSKNITLSKDVVFMFISSSVPISSVKRFILEASILNYYFNTKVTLVFQGFSDIEYEKKLVTLKNDLIQYESSKIFINNLNRVIDPKIYKDLNITKVPVFAYASHNGDFYPSDTTIQYILRGDSSLENLFKFISQEDSKYEEYYNHIINTK